MPLTEQNDYGTISISENVLKDMVYKTVEKYLKEEKIFNEKIQKDLQKSIKVSVNDDTSVSIYLKIPAKYGENIVEYSKRAQKKIKDELEKLAQVYVSNIDITIETISKPEEIEEEFEEFMEEETEKELAEEEDSSKVEDEEEKNKQNE
ncbi:MAG: Asp23/Gls24 family envelope stress response protein [Defluviitoga tunisiensis]|mgnify:FL=1|jgi:uncharacterized alkaline shock family protein YloU|uniref:Asp23/Gls24 family envelope stress response protein n=1 Tax=Defluviitoga tunisiensis TaxID=1006576 RepID=A0A0C7P037_DEFTU|nr:Asp23/Gls24 family envelope stress response protein [Defluviitoga tunisiensis]MDD3600488.1 Asp23/Gls24 family envelope stress response protein [Defluviitoga tunisiensis]MDY0379129.1 Asp23/Gls24 family envelope stress response protein [Defluviitoga tunisiensis]CEP77610.1 hypothetical protein DTL3_0279 [Defluviitoga tunisiensis]HHV00634.1 Asp23/Gls24 family envelope stress response protein [Defluviitoga tunisiensis]HOB55285.1 Asp23/Gls24 family envelope stress response protein [Defluviitoga t